MKTSSARLRITKKISIDEACERLDKRFSYVESNEFMSLVKTWIKEILKEKGC